MGHRPHPELRTERKSSKNYRTPLRHGRIVPKRKGRKYCFSSELKQSKIMVRINRQNPHGLDTYSPAFLKTCNGQNLALWLIDRLRQYMGICCDPGTTANNKAGSSKLEPRISCCLKGANCQNRMLDIPDYPRNVISDHTGSSNSAARKKDPSPTGHPQGAEPPESKNHFRLRNPHFQ